MIPTDELNEDELDPDDKLAEYMGWNMDIHRLLELWMKLDPYFGSADEVGIAYYMVYHFGADAIRDVLAAPLIEQLTSEDPGERQDAIDKMREMGYDLTRI